MSIPVLPPSAPFTAEQRAWLNGFFAGLYGMDAASASSIAATGDSTPAPSVAADSTPTEADSGDYPWHDPALPLDERMALAEGKPIQLKMMAAMAQLDCGQCGYECKSYAAAIADGTEKSLRKCVPGEKPTANKLKELIAA